MPVTDNEQNNQRSSSIVFFLVFLAICAAVAGIFALVFLVLAPSADPSYLLIGFLSILGLFLILVLVAMIMTSFQSYLRVMGTLQIICLVLCIGSSIMSAVIALNPSDNHSYNSNGSYSSKPSSSHSSSSTGFKNKYGTADTKCAKAGCSKKIATSGDTMFCTSHSNKCLNCYCYIDNDAMYCMTCIKNALD